MSSKISVEFPVAWGEMDALAHVNNVMYFRYFETARIAYFREMGMSFEPAGPILASTSCDFVAPLTYPDTIRVDTWLIRVGRSSFTMAYEVHSLGHGRLAARGTGVLVWYDYSTGRSAPLPEDLRARMESSRPVEGSPS
jgi:acyl-CoA thioester hydrolase